MERKPGQGRRIRRNTEKTLRRETTGSSGMRTTVVNRREGELEPKRNRVTMERMPGQRGRKIRRNTGEGPRRKKGSSRRRTKIVINREDGDLEPKRKRVTMKRRPGQGRRARRNRRYRRNNGRRPRRRTGQGRRVRRNRRNNGRRPRRRTDVQINISVREHNYYVLLFNDAEAPSGFSAALPSGDWLDLGVMPVSACVSACAAQSRLVMAMRSTSGGAGSCRCSSAADMSALQRTFPPEAGWYQLFDLAALTVGQTRRFSYGSLIDVTSETLPNGYQQFSATVQGESGSSRLVSYFTASAPDTVLWLPTTFLSSAAECVARCFGLRFTLALVRPSGQPLCLCGDLRPGAQLALTDTSPPTQPGSLQVVQLPPQPPAAEKAPASADGTYRSPTIMASWLTPTLCRVQMDNEPAAAQYSRVSALRDVHAVSLAAPGDRPERCVAACLSLFFKWAALSEQHCLCTDSDVPLEPDWSAGDDVLTVINTGAYLPQPDGSNMMQYTQLPNTNYARFVVGNVLQPCGYTTDPVPADGAGPPPAGRWTLVPAQQSSPAGCVVQCAVQPGGPQPYAAVLPLGPRAFQCWCAATGDLSEYSSAVPEQAGRAQIYDFTQIIQRMMKA